MENYQVDHNNKIFWNAKCICTLICLLACLLTFWSVDWLTVCLASWLVYHIAHPIAAVNVVVFFYFSLFFLMSPFTWPYKHEILVISARSKKYIFSLGWMYGLLLTNWLFAHVSGFIFDNSFYSSSSKYKHLYFIWFDFFLSVSVFKICNKNKIK